jgi:hypothetical protein
MELCAAAMAIPIIIVTQPTSSLRRDRYSNFSSTSAPASSCRRLCRKVPEFASARKPRPIHRVSFAPSDGSSPFTEWANVTLR